MDSIFEYLVKGSILFNDPSLLEKWRLLETPIETYLNNGDDFYIWANMNSGATTQKVAQSLGESSLISISDFLRDGFFPGMKTLLGEVEHAMKIHLNYYNVWKQFGGWPEFYHVDKKLPIQGREGIESIF